MGTMELTDYQRDELKEVGNIGSGKTSVALSDMISKPVKVEMTDLRMVSLEQLSSTMDDSLKDPVSILLPMTGDIKGHILLLSPKKTSLKVIGMMMGAESKELDGDGMEALKELGNILVGAYIAAMADLSKLKLIEGLPEVLTDDLKIVVDKNLGKYSVADDPAIMIGTKMFIESDEFEEELVLILEKGSFDTLFKALKKLD